MPPIEKSDCSDANGTRFHIAIIADLDKKGSKVKGDDTARKSILKKGILHQSKDKQYKIEWTEEKQVSGKLLEKGRGFELSELKVFNGKLYTCDDRTGVIYWLKKDEQGEYSAIPWVILNDGPGDLPKGFKGEWLTIKDGIMYVGSHGNEWMKSPTEVRDRNKMWIKTVDKNGCVQNHNWRKVYEDARTACGVQFPGYLTHEAANWSEVTKRWNFLPRKLSHTVWEEKNDEISCTNLLISCNDKFEDWKTIAIGEKDAQKGFAGFKYIPGTNEEVCIAIKSTEIGDSQATEIMVFNIHGTVLLKEDVAALKYEGIEISCGEL